ncbi:hypothetical protein ABL78_2729 [Leptomonas seymouri]|uniref:Uncharacterized protein n=1 Tax=Leptomonas seymouri TaxID=5684 RepID=A0A0N1PD43_LEPSE|nr:hypothetical protein ABL78_2729 [Leptomonas seymouri]|eukprot:KPI88225.1 hypothetical protein ABL78_2729 [Leptomonas seymouri]
MGNTSLTGHGSATCRHEEIRAKRSHQLGKGRTPDTSARVGIHASSKHNTNVCCETAARTTNISSLPAHKGDMQLRLPFSAPVESASVAPKADRQLDTSAIVQCTLLMSQYERELPSDSFAEGVRSAEVLSEMEFDSISSCPLIGPRNITTQFEQSSEAPISASRIFANDTQHWDAMIQKQSSSAGEAMLQESYESRMARSTAIVEEWLISLATSS